MRYSYNLISLSGRKSGIVRRVNENKGAWGVCPPKEIMRAVDLTPDTPYETIILHNGGVAIIPVKLDKNST